MCINPDRNGKWLAYELGFTQLNSFYRWFKSTYGDTFSGRRAA